MGCLCNSFKWGTAFHIFSILETDFVNVSLIMNETSVKIRTFATKLTKHMMKKIAFLLIASVLVACGGGKTSSKPKETRGLNKTIKGEWTLQSVTYNQKGKFDITLLNDTSKECFEGSSWKFVPNNNRGTYTINNDDCSTGGRNFVFVVQEIDKTTGYYDFLLKPTNEKFQSETNQGIRLRLAYLSETNMTWEQTVSVEGKPFVISMNFVK